MTQEMQKKRKKNNQQTFTCLKETVEPQERCVKSVSPYRYLMNLNTLADKTRHISFSKGRKNQVRRSLYFLMTLIYCNSSR